MNAFFSEDLKKTATQTLLRALVAYNRFYIKTKINYRFARKKNAAFNLLCECFETIFTILTELFVSFTCNKLEPSDPTWVSYCQYKPTGNGLGAITRDEYVKMLDSATWSTDLDTVLDPQNPFHDIFCKSLRKHCNLSYSKESAEDLLIGKLCPSATMVRIANHINPDNLVLNMKTSSARFLEVEYKCGDRPPLTIEVPKSHYFSGNEVLSKTYVLRYLEHLPIYSRWTFNETEYSLRIVDEDSEVFSLNCNQYILLERDGYRIIDQSNLPYSLETKEPVEN